MSNEVEDVPLTTLVFDKRLYPRDAVSYNHVTEIMRAMEGGNVMPPVVACRTTKKLVDGVHRWRAAQRKETELISVEWRDYTDDAERFRDAVSLNTSHGLNFSEKDRLRVLEMGQEFGLKELDFASILHTSPGYIKSIMPRFASVADDPKAGEAPERRPRVPLTPGTRHLADKTVTPEQAEAIRRDAPTTSYLPVVRQLITALENDLLPPESQHPRLWADLHLLAHLLAKAGAGSTEA